MRNIPFSPPDIGEAEIREVADALASGWITTGKRTKEFEKRLADFIGTQKVVCLSSATAAMETTLRILGIGPGDEVITTAYTYTATASVIHHVGAKIVLADVLPGSFEIDPARVADKITEKTKAVMPVDLGGRVCDSNPIREVIERKKGLFQPNSDLQRLFGRVVILSDSAHALGAIRAGKNCGQIADFTCYSFHAVKNLTTAEGGAVTWLDYPGLDSDALYREYMLASLHGQSKDAFSKNQAGSWEYDILYPAYKCNMTDIQAAIGLRQLDRYPDMLARRREIVRRYDDAFLPLGGEPLRHFDIDGISSCHLYLLRFPGIDERERNEIIRRLAEKGIAANVHYKPLPLLTAYRNMGFLMEDYPNAYAQYRNEVSLPLYTRLTDEDVDYIIDAVSEELRRTAER